MYGGELMTSAKETTKKDILPEIIAAIYSADRAEITSRRRMRLATLFSFNIVAIPLLMWTHYNKDMSEILFILPFLSFAAVLIVCGEDTYIGRISLSCARLMGSFVRNNETHHPQSETPENSKILTFYHFFWKVLTYLILLELTPFLALYYNKEHILNSGFPELILWWLGACIIIASSIALIIIQIRRWDLYKKEIQLWKDKKR